MPKNPSRGQRVEWHAQHAEACGCRPVPPDLAGDVASLTEARRKRTATKVSRQGGVR